MEDININTDKRSWGRLLFRIIATVFEGLVIFVTANTAFSSMILGMGDQASFKVGFLVMGAIVIWFLMLMECTSTPSSDHDNVRILFFVMLMITNVDLIGTILLTVGVGTEGSLFTGALLVILATPAVVTVFWFYQRAICFGDKAPLKKADLVVIMGGLADLIPIFANAFTGHLFYFDENNMYAEADRIAGTYIYPFLVLVLCLVRNFGKNDLPKKIHISLAIFSITPMFLAAVALATSNNIYSHSAYIIGLLIIYAEIQVNRQAELYAQRQSVVVQREMLLKDPLTSLFSRYAYARELEAIGAGTEIPSDLVVFAMDVNGLKDANDTKGHEAGDELIKGSAKCIEETLSAFGKCFRTGGDEFVAILCLQADSVDAAVEDLKKRTAQWHGELVDELSISVGTASAADHAGLDMPGLVKAADLKMYEDKERFYATSGKNRRRSRRSDDQKQ